MWKSKNWRKSVDFSQNNKKKSVPGKFYRQTVQNISYFNKKMTFTIRNKQKTDKNTYHCVKISKNNKYLLKRFQRHELFAVVNNSVT